MGCTAEDLLRSLPMAFPGVEVITDSAAAVVRVNLPDGHLEITWQPLPARRIALLEIPRLQVRFVYAGLTPERRHEVQRRFDLATQRGGG